MRPNYQAVRHIPREDVYLEYQKKSLANKLLRNNQCASGRIADEYSSCKQYLLLPSNNMANNEE